MAKFYPLFSSSRANASCLVSGNAGILIDAGASYKKILHALSCNTLSPDCIQGVFITHTHSDHIKGLQMLLKQLHLTVYGTEETLSFLAGHGDFPPGTSCIPVCAGAEPVCCGNFSVQAFPTMHDAEGSCGYRIQTGDGKCCAVCTDFGTVTPEVHRGIRGCDMLLLEANYEPDLLWNGSYPVQLKRRIASAYGHLSNQASAALGEYCIRNGTTRLLLGHLSPENNTPELVAAAMGKTLQEFRQGQDYLLGIAPVETQGGAVIF